jgi:myo-inositol-1(or 4)-monophosphatase
LKPWDIAAGIVLVREAGGMVSELNGVEADLLAHGHVLATNGALHAEVGRLLQGRKAAAA